MAIIRLYGHVQDFLVGQVLFVVLLNLEKDILRKFDKNLNIASNVEEITKEEIIKNYDDKFKVVPKNLIKHFDKKILNLNNLNIVNLDHNELEFLQFNDLLDEASIIPLYLG